MSIILCITALTQIAIKAVSTTIEVYRNKTSQLSRKQTQIISKITQCAVNPVVYCSEFGKKGNKV